MNFPRSHFALITGASVLLVIFVATYYFSRAPDDADFDGEKAFQHVAAIVALGPRPPGSAAMESQRQYLESKLAKLGWTTTRQSFSESTIRGDIEFTNLRARFVDEPIDWHDGGNLVLLCSHYDTKFYDNFVFVGANDGGSSTGALLEMARVLAMKPKLAQQIELVFFDGEECIGENYTATDGLFGSRYYARKFRGAPPNKKPRFGILLDMIGDRNLGITSPAPPSESPRHLLLPLWAAAKELGYREKFALMPISQRNPTGGITDDHIPLNQAGIPTLNLIDMDYAPYWHTSADTIDKISAQSLEIVGRTVLLTLKNLLLEK